jgi:hypothetical protein
MWRGPGGGKAGRNHHASARNDAERCWSPGSWVAAMARPSDAERRLGVRARRGMGEVVVVVV